MPTTLKMNEGIENGVTRMPTKNIPIHVVKAPKHVPTIRAHDSSVLTSPLRAFKFGLDGVQEVVNRINPLQRQEEERKAAERNRITQLTDWSRMYDSPATRLYRDKIQVVNLIQQTILKSDSPELVRQLMKNEEGVPYTFDHATLNGIADLALRHGRFETAKLITQKLDLHRALKLNLDYSQLKMMLDMGADANAMTYGGRTVLHSVVEMLHTGVDSKKNLSKIELLLQYGANVNSKDTSGLTPLHTAVRNDQVELAINLVQKGADNDIRGGIFQTIEGTRISDLTPLEVASIRNSEGLTKWNDSNYTRLQEAIERSKTHTIEQASPKVKRDCSFSQNIQTQEKRQAKGMDIPSH